MQIITDTPTLEQAISQWQEAPYVCLDTEFHREKTYYPELCLIQVGIPQEKEPLVWLIDPFSERLDLKPFWAWLRTSKQPKILHAAKQDMEIFYHEMGGLPSHIFDTQIAAMFCGLGDQVSYAQLVKETTGKHIEKGHQFSDWTRRPLSDKQLAYAADDVRLLPAVYETICRRLDKGGRRAWIEADMGDLLEEEQYFTHPEKAWERLKLRTRTPRAVAAARHLAEWREKEAQTLDKPRGWILKDEAIAEITAVMPKTIEQLKQLRGIGNHMPRARLEGLLDVIERVRAIPDADLPRLSKPARAQDPDTATVDLLKNLLKLRTEEAGIVPRMVASMDELRELANGNRDGLHCMQGWRYEMFGKDAERLLAGEIGLGMVKGQARVIELA